MTIRLEGFPHEVDQAQRILEQDPTIGVIRVSRDYSSKGSVYVRRYITIEFHQKESERHD